MIDLRNAGSSARRIRLATRVRIIGRNGPVAQQDGFSLADDSLVPLINLVFLLIVFFLIAGTLARKDLVAAEPPVSASQQRAVGADRTLVLQADGQLWWDGEPVVAADLATLVRRRMLTPAVSDDPAIGVEPGLALHLRADANVPVSLLRAVLGRLRAAGIVRITLVTRLEQ